MTDIYVPTVVIEELKVCTFCLTFRVISRYHKVLEDSVPNVKRSAVDLIVPEERD
jgi:hypothetical protein